MTEDVAEAGEKRIGAEPTDGLGAVEAGVVVFGGCGRTEGDESGGEEYQKHVCKFEG